MPDAQALPANVEYRCAHIRGQMAGFGLVGHRGFQFLARSQDAQAAPFLQQAVERVALQILERDWRGNTPSPPLKEP